MRNLNPDPKYSYESGSEHANDFGSVSAYIKIYSTAVLWIRIINFFFSDSDPAVALISDPGSVGTGLFIRNTFELQII